MAVWQALFSFVDSLVISHTLPSHHYTFVPIFCQFPPLDSPILAMRVHSAHPQSHSALTNSSANWVTNICQQTLRQYDAQMLYRFLREIEYYKPSKPQPISARHQEPHVAQCHDWFHPKIVTTSQKTHQTPPPSLAFDPLLTFLSHITHSQIIPPSFILWYPFSNSLHQFQASPPIFEPIQHFPHIFHLLTCFHPFLLFLTHSYLILSYIHLFLLFLTYSQTLPPFTSLLHTSFF